MAAIVDEKILCMHGGLSPELQNMEQIKRIMRPTDIPDTGLLCDLLWADPDKDIVGWGENDRGVSFTFGEDVVAQFLRRHDLDLVCRAHQVVEDGYEFFARRQLVTIFSAPNYCGEFDNAGAMMSVDETLMCSFQILKPAEKRQRLSQGVDCKSIPSILFPFILSSWCSSLHATIWSKVKIGLDRCLKFSPDLPCLFSSSDCDSNPPSTLHSDNNQIYLLRLVAATQIIPLPVV